MLLLRSLLQREVQVFHGLRDGRNQWPLFLVARWNFFTYPSFIEEEVLFEFQYIRTTYLTIRKHIAVEDVCTKIWLTL